MAQETRVALVGCGFFAQNHLHGWKDLEEAGARLVAVCDVDAAKARAACAAFGVPAYTSLQEMLDVVKPDLVDVTTRMNTHVEICLELARRGIAAIVQKPLAPTWEDCLTIARAARQHGSFLAVHENFRYQTPMLEVKRQIAAGVIGTPNWARLAFRTGYDVYSNQPYFYTEERLAIQRRRHPRDRFGAGVPRRGGMGELRDPAPQSQSEGRRYGNADDAACIGCSFGGGGNL